MRFYEYGKSDLPAVMLIHGGGNSKWMFERQAGLLKENYRVILPELDGHGSANDTVYPSTKGEADKIVDYIEKNCGGSLFVIAGASLGGQIAMEVLARLPHNIKGAFLESCICFPKPALAGMMNHRFMINSMSAMYNWMWMVRWSCKSYGWPVEYAEQLAKEAKALSTESSMNLYRTYLNYIMPDSLMETTAKVQLMVGSKEKGMMRKDIEQAAGKIAHSEVVVLKGYNHCGFSLGEPVKYVEELERFMSVL